MRWHALARATGQGHVATPNSALSHFLHDVHGGLPIGISRTYRDRFGYRTDDACGTGYAFAKGVREDLSVDLHRSATGMLRQVDFFQSAPSVRGRSLYNHEKADKRFLDSRVADPRDDFGGVPIRTGECLATYVVHAAARRKRLLLRSTDLPRLR